MRRLHIRVRIKIYPILWSGIILISVYLLIRFAVISFSDDMGQASFREAVISKVCGKLIESGNSLISYTEKTQEDTYAFPISLIDDEFVLEKFVTDNSILTAKAQGYSSLFDQNDLNSKGEEIIEVSDSETVQEDPDRIETLGYYEIEDGYLSKEYILTNGVVLNSLMANLLGIDNEAMVSNQLQIGYLNGEVDIPHSEEDVAEEETSSEVVAANAQSAVEYTMDQLKDINFLIRNFYIVDGSTKVTEELFDAEKLLGKDMTLKQENDAPQILIYHTHSQETYIDSRPGKEADTVVGVGSYLTKILREEYGYNVIHDKTTYDVIDGKSDRNKAYTMAEKGLDKILKENPTIEVIIDLHRDSPAKRSIVIDGEETAQIMLFNGLSRDQNGPITYLDNPNLQDNLAFSLQLQMGSMDLYPGLFFRNYLKCWRYNMHVRPKCLLMELGTQYNTLQSAKNAMEPFAEVLDAVLQGEDQDDLQEEVQEEIQEDMLD